jgi:hypothetical protein
LIASPARVRPGETVTLTVIISHPQFGELPPDDYRIFHDQGFRFQFSSDDPRLDKCLEHHASARKNPAVISRMPSLPDGDYEIRVEVTPVEDIDSHRHGWPAQLNIDNGPNWPESMTASTSISLVAQRTEARVVLQRSASVPTDDQALWAAIRNRTAAMGFTRYQRFIDHVLGADGEFSTGFNAIRGNLIRGGLVAGDGQLNSFGPYAYSVLKLATQAFLTMECGVVIRDRALFDVEKETVRFDDPDITVESLQERLAEYLVHPDSQTSVLPYLNRIVTAFVSLDRDDEPSRREGLPFFEGILRNRLTAPSMIELIWSYWLEEGMLVQTMNAIARRFQNQRGSERDPLVELEFDSLRPLGPMIWGYIQDENNRLTVARRSNEYRHQYGLSLEGKAVGGIYPADSRSKFIEAFHNLLYRTDRFYREDRDTTMIADAFPLLNALKEVHLLLAEGAHNQFGDLTWTARGEMLITQWMLARPEMREFLRGRYMVPYQEHWMGAVDAMKRLQGWGDTSITYFHELAVTGERILLSIRYGDWSDINNIEEQAKNWARNSKPEVQRYLHDYRTVTGVDLTADMTDTRDAETRYLPPSTLLKRRLANMTQGAIASADNGLRALRAPPLSQAAPPSRPMAALPARKAGAD